MDNWTTVLVGKWPDIQGTELYNSTLWRTSRQKISSCIDDIQSVVSRNNFNIHLPPALNIAGLKYTGLHLWMGILFACLDRCMFLPHHSQPHTQTHTHTFGRVGKTSLMNQYVNKKFTNQYKEEGVVGYNSRTFAWCTACTSRLSHLTETCVNEGHHWCWLFDQRSHDRWQARDNAGWSSWQEGSG